jgi:hypothetical protein
MGVDGATSAVFMGSFLACVLLAFGWRRWPAWLTCAIGALLVRLRTGLGMVIGAGDLGSGGDAGWAVWETLWWGACLITSLTVATWVVSAGTRVNPHRHDSLAPYSLIRTVAVFVWLGWSLLPMYLLGIRPAAPVLGIWDPALPVGI